MRVFLIIVLIFLTCFSSFVQTDPVVNKIIEIGKTDNQTMDHLDVLCNRFGGRPIGSDAYENAAEWAAYKFKEWGMEVKIQLNVHAGGSSTIVSGLMV